MKALKVTKMSGSGNDFIIIDNRFDLLKGVSLPNLARILCQRRKAVGADGLILVENSKVANFKWRFFNADGSEAEMCGNGGRCVSRFAVIKGIAPSRLTFETLAGIIHAEVKNRKVKLQLPPPTALKLNQKILVESKTYQINVINTGVPHAVLVVENLEEFPVKKLGEKIRFHPIFQPSGTNVNFIEVIDKFSLKIRTYERGVEDETLACGTGSVAAALIASALNLVKSPVGVKTWGGEVLTIYFEKNLENSFSRVYLQGDTCLVFEGELGEDLLEELSFGQNYPAGSEIILI
jgi:diaminopimelate epimerase